MNDLHDLEVLLRSRVPLITIETHDEKRVTQLFASLALKLAGLAIDAYAIYLYWRK